MGARRAGRGPRGVAGGNVSFATAAPVAGETVFMLAAPPEEKPRKPQ
jgi:hypothetical protein